MKTGQILKEKYRIDSELSSKGGFGIVYVGTVLQTGQTVAVKEIKPAQKQKEAEATQNPAEESWEKKKEEFLVEARILEKLREIPQVVQVFDYADEGDTAYIVMELLHGGTLKTMVHREGKPTAEEAYRLITELLGILEKVHSCGIIHRDIAPDNIYILSSGQMKLFDFGIAHAFGEGQEQKTWVDAKKKGYTPLEQLRKSKQQGPQTDVYAAAAVYYELLTGTKPPDADERRKNDPLVPPVRAGADISAEEEKVILEALAVEAGNRIPTAGDFLRKLKAAHHKTRRGKLGKKLLLAAGLLLILGIAGIAAVNLRRSRLTGEAAGEPSLEGATAPESVTSKTEALESVGSDSSEHGTKEPEAESLKPETESETALPTAEETGMVIVPDITGMGESEAVEALKQRSLSYRKTAEPSTLVPKGKILRQEPVGGAEAETDSVVEIVISLGTQEDTTTAPLVTLEPRTTAAPATKAPAVRPTSPPATQPPATENYYAEPTISENVG